MKRGEAEVPQRGKKHCWRWLLWFGALLLIGPWLLWGLTLLVLGLPTVQRSLLARWLPEGVAIRWERVRGWPGSAMTLDGVAVEGAGWQLRDARLRLVPDWRRGRGREWSSWVGLSSWQLDGGQMMIILNELNVGQVPQATATTAAAIPWPRIAQQGLQTGVLVAVGARIEGVEAGTESGPGPSGLAPSLPGGAVVPPPTDAASEVVRDSAWARLLRSGSARSLRAEVRQRRGGQVLATVERLGWESSDDQGDAAISWLSVSLLGKELLPQQKMALRWTGQRVLLRAPLTMVIPGPIQLQALAVFETPQRSGGLLELSWEGAVDPSWQQWMDGLGLPTRAEDWQGRAQLGLSLRGSPGQAQGEARLRMLGLSYQGEPMVELGALLAHGSAGTPLRMEQLVLKLAKQRGWLLGNGQWRRDGSVLGVARVITGSGTAFGLGWCDPRARAGQWVAGFQPLADPAMWYRDVVFVGNSRELMVNLTDPEKLAPLAEEWPRWLASLRQQQAPLGEWIEGLTSPSSRRLNASPTAPEVP